VTWPLGKLKVNVFKENSIEIGDVFEEYLKNTSMLTSFPGPHCSVWGLGMRLPACNSIAILVLLTA